jgi:hypothetical protein
VRCGAVRCGAVRCGAVRCGAVRCGAVRCGAAHKVLLKCAHNTRASTGTRDLELVYSFFLCTARLECTGTVPVPVFCFDYIHFFAYFAYLLCSSMQQTVTSIPSMSFLTLSF